MFRSCSRPLAVHLLRGAGALVLLDLADLERFPIEMNRM